MQNYLSKEEDMKFSRTVIECNKSNEENEREEKMECIRARTRILIYKVSREMLHMTEDEASSVFLAMNEDLDRIISSYRVSTTTYNIYLRQLCQYRGRRIKREEMRKSVWENAYLMEECWSQLYGAESQDFFENTARRPETPNTKEDTIFKDMKIKELFDYILKNRDSALPSFFNSREKRLSIALTESITARKHFLIFLLTLPSSSEGADSLDLSRVLQIEEKAVMAFMERKAEYASSSDAKRETALSTANKHWRIMARIQESIRVETDERKKESMQSHYQRIARCHRNQLIKARKATRGMTRNEIAEALGISTSAIAMAIKRTAGLLESITMT